MEEKVAMLTEGRNDSEQNCINKRDEVNSDSDLSHLSAQNTDIKFSFDNTTEQFGKFSGVLKLKCVNSGGTIKQLAEEIADNIPLLAIHRICTVWGNQTPILDHQAGELIGKRFLEGVDIIDPVIVDNIFSRATHREVLTSTSKTFMDRFSHSNQINIEMLIKEIGAQLKKLYGSAFMISAIRNTLIEEAFADKDGLISYSFQD